MALISHASHPHFEADGSMLTVGMRLGPLGPKYVINKIPAYSSAEANDSLRITFELGAADCFRKGQEVANVKSRWMLDPGYMHSFSVTENYYILIEQPLCVNVPKLIKSFLSSNDALIDGMVWHGKSPTLFHIIPKDNSIDFPGKKLVYQSDAMFFTHT